MVGVEGLILWRNGGHFRSAAWPERILAEKLFLGDISVMSCLYFTAHCWDNFLPGRER